MDFGNFGEMSVMIGYYRKLKIKFQMRSGKRRVHSVSGRHDDPAFPDDIRFCF